MKIFYNRKALSPTRWSTPCWPGRGLQTPDRRRPAAARRRVDAGGDRSARRIAGHSARRRSRDLSLVTRRRIRRGRRRGWSGRGIGPHPDHHGPGNPGRRTPHARGIRPFPTELFDAHGEYLPRPARRDDGRRRRCGWFDSVIARLRDPANGITDYFTKLDALSSLETSPSASATPSTASAPTRCR